MKGKVLLGVLVVLATSQFASASYDSMTHNLLGGAMDTAFDSGTGVFSINDTTVSLTHTTSPGIVPPGIQGNATVALSTNLVDYNTSVPGKALFTGGTFSLNFAFDADGAGPGGFQNYQIGGPIDGLVVWYQVLSTSLTRFYGEGLWTAVTKNLPTDWLDNNGFSSITTLTIDIGQDLGGYDWTYDMQGQSSYTLYPDDRAAPEPGTLLLLAGGVGLFARRRRTA